MNTITILREAELRQCVGVNAELIAAIEEAFTGLAEGRAQVPPIIGVDIPEHHGDLDIKTAYVQGLPSFAIKFAAGFNDNPQRGLPVASGMMILVSAVTGFPEAALFDNGFLTQARTAAAGAIAARYLALPEVETAGVIGSGAQARYQMLGLQQVRSFQRLRIYGDISKDVDRYIKEMEPVLGVEIVKERSAEAVVRGSQVVVTTTPSRAPYLRAEWLHPGLHITAMGADSPGKQELYAGVFRRADLIVCDRKAQCVVRGELHHALEEGCLDEQAPVIELGELTSGRRPGRTSPEQISLCDLTGVGVQDTAIALLAYRKAQAMGLGMRLET